MDREGEAEACRSRHLRCSTGENEDYDDAADVVCFGVHETLARQYCESRRVDATGSLAQVLMPAVVNLTSAPTADASAGGGAATSGPLLDAPTPLPKRGGGRRALARNPAAPDHGYNLRNSGESLRQVTPTGDDSGPQQERATRSEHTSTIQMAPPPDVPTPIPMRGAAHAAKRTSFVARTPVVAAMMARAKRCATPLSGKDLPPPSVTSPPYRDYEPITTSHETTPTENRRDSENIITPNLTEQAQGGGERDDHARVMPSHLNMALMFIILAVLSFAAVTIINNANADFSVALISGVSAVALHDQ